ncbi:hypothetical protein ACU4GR_13250 [Methylobacterium oryzae CBMB20]
MGIGVFIVAAGAVNILTGIGYEHPQFMVVAAGLFADGVVAIFR